MTAGKTPEYDTGQPNAVRRLHELHKQRLMPLVLRLLEREISCTRSFLIGHLTSTQNGRGSWWALFKMDLLGKWSAPNTIQSRKESGKFLPIRFPTQRTNLLTVW